MNILLDLPSPVEGRWHIKDADGKTVLNSADIPGAQLHVTPNFYGVRKPQTLATATSRGRSGKTTRQILQVSAVSGKVVAIPVPPKPQTVVPIFDQADTPAPETPVEQ